MRTFIKLVLVAATSSLAACGPTSDHSAKVGKSVRQALEASEDVFASVVITTPGGISQDLVGREATIAEIQASIAELLPESEASIVHRFEATPGFSIKLKSLTALELLATHENVEAIDSDVPGGGNLDTTRNIVGADKAFWGDIAGNKRVVAVVDTGVDRFHPALAGDIKDEACRCTFSTTCCPLGPHTSGPGSAKDDHGHGTHVSGIVTSSGINTTLPSADPNVRIIETTARGTAPGADLVVVRMMQNVDGFSRFGDTSDIVAALEWIRSTHPEVDSVNLSLGTDARFIGDCDNATAWTTNLYNAVQALKNQGISVVVSAGNDWDKQALEAPACLSNVISVGNVFDSLEANASSNAGASLDVFAPGTDVVSTALGGGTISMTGTSMAAPQVAAAIALIRQANPAVQPEQIQQCLARTCKSVNDAGTTRPLLNIPAAIARCGGGVPIPARIEAEDYVDYSDLSPGNSGNACRSENVDMEATTDAGGGFNVGWTEAGDRLTYRISSPLTQDYDIKLRTAAMNAGNRVRLQLDGADLGTLDVPGTNGWQNFQTITKAKVRIPAGKHTLNVLFETGGINLNWIDVVALGVALPARIEAEQYAAFGEKDADNNGGKCRAGDVDQESTADNAGVCNVGWTAPGEWLEYRVSSATSRSYSIVLRASSAMAGNTASVQLDGATIGRVTVPQSSWQGFSDLTLPPVNFTQGTHKLRVVFNTGNVNLNYLSIQ